MRDLKFRAWTGTEMMFQNASSSGETWYPIGFTNMPPYSGQPILMQYTGLKDRKAVDIYEGDFIQGDLFDKRVPIRGGVVYDKEHACWALKNLAGLTFLFRIDKKEIIGNIHENPELLTNEKK